MCQTVRWVLATPMETGRQRPLHIFVHIQFWENYCLEGDASWRAGRYQAWWVGNIMLGEQSQIEKAHSRWPKYCIKWGRWKAGVEKAGVENAARYGRSRTVGHLCNMLQWIKRLVSGDRDYMPVSLWSKRRFRTAAITLHLTIFCCYSKRNFKKLCILSLTKCRMREEFHLCSRHAC